MDYKAVVAKLNEFAPLKLAEKWDNVGLLVEPTPPLLLNSILVTNDLTEEVLQEALEKKANMIISYHPPIFSALKRITQRDAKERIVIKCIENRIAVYSPHTSLDSVCGGINDWLVDLFSPFGIASRAPLTPNSTFPSSTHKLGFSVTAKLFDHLSPHFKTIEGIQNISTYYSTSSQDIRVEILTSKDKIPHILKAVQSHLGPEAAVPLLPEVYALEQLPVETVGQGRTLSLSQPVPLQQIIDHLKSALGLKTVGVATPAPHDTHKTMIRTVALCAGSGATVLENVKADLYLTGEMTHHQFLSATAQGTSVIVCRHSNTERGYLRHYVTRLSKLIENDKIHFIVSEKDADPIVEM